MVSMRPLLLLAVLAALTPAAPLQAQEVPATPPLEVGAVAPDFTLPAATRYGILRDQVRLSDYRGQTVVLAFFFRARTRG
jgi:thioredoxin-dependent peroxiredoxin